jgi:hypothetical protein
MPKERDVRDSPKLNNPTDHATAASIVRRQYLADVPSRPTLADDQSESVAAGDRRGHARRAICSRGDGHPASVARFAGSVSDRIGSRNLGCPRNLDRAGKQLGEQAYERDELKGALGIVLGEAMGARIPESHYGPGEQHHVAPLLVMV